MKSRVFFFFGLSFRRSRLPSPHVALFRSAVHAPRCMRHLQPGSSLLLLNSPRFASLQLPACLITMNWPWAQAPGVYAGVQKPIADRYLGYRSTHHRPAGPEAMGRTRSWVAGSHFVNSTNASCGQVCPSLNGTESADCTWPPPPDIRVPNSSHVECAVQQRDYPQQDCTDTCFHGVCSLCARHNASASCCCVKKTDPCCCTPFSPQNKSCFLAESMREWYACDDVCKVNGVRPCDSCLHARALA